LIEGSTGIDAAKIEEVITKIKKECNDFEELGESFV